MLKEFDLQGKVAIVTGAGRGIGQGVALVLAEAGVDIVVAEFNKDGMEDTVRKVQGLGRKSIGVLGDMTNVHDVENMTKAAVSNFGKVDIMVNNAGVSLIKPLVPLPGAKSSFSKIVPGFDNPTSVQEIRLTLETNLLSTTLCCRSIGPQMIKQMGGRVINISSVWAAQANAYYGVYSAAKAGVSALSKCLAKEWGRYNITVNTIMPGYFPTPLTSYFYEDEKLKESMLRQVPLGRFGNSARDIGLVISFLASDAASYVSGQVIAVDGGLV